MSQPFTSKCESTVTGRSCVLTGRYNPGESDNESGREGEVCRKLKSQFCS